MFSFFRWRTSPFHQPQLDRTQLKNEVSRWINQTREQPTDTLLLHDASGSVTPRDFALGQQAASLLIDQFGSDTRIAVAQFASECTLECPLTDNKELVKARNQNMRPSGGDTKTELALQLALEVMAKGRPGALKLVFLITDGHPDDDYEARLAASDLRRASVQIVGIGIGRVSLGKLSDICGRHSSFILPSYEALVEAMTGQSLQQQRALAQGQSPEISFYIEGPKSPIKLLEPYRLRIEIRNVGDREVVEGSRLIIEGGQFFPSHVVNIDKPVVPGDVRVLVVDLKPKTDATANQLPEYLEFRLQHPTTGLLHPAQNPRFHIHLSDFIADLQKWHLPVPGVSVANILVFGELGAGKSTLINSLLSLTSKTFQDPAISLRQETHVTTFLAPYRPTNANFRLVDSVGLKFEGNEQHDLASILEGKYSFGRNRTSEDVHNPEESKEREIHACILVVSRGFFSNFSQQSGSFEIVKGFIHELVQHGLHPIVAVTQVDKSTESELTKLSQTVERVTGIPRDRIFLIDNSRPRAKELEKEKVLYSLLSMSLNSCDFTLKLKYDIANPAPSRRRSSSSSSSRLSVSSTDQLASKVHYLVLFDEPNNIKNEIYAEMLPESDRLTKLRKAIEDQVPGIGQFEFVNVYSGDMIAPSLEKNVPVRFSARQEESEALTILIRRKVPPPYSKA